MASNDDDDSSDSPERESEEEEVFSEETPMNQLDTFEKKLHARRACGILFSDDGDTPSTSSEPRRPKSCRRSDEESSDDWM
jgi:hypothetical protein